jgi:outer membrane protein assembly factor BamB
VALIELDLDAPPAHPPSRPPARYYRSVAIFAVAVLLMALGGAAPPAAVLWQRTGLVPLGGAATSFQLVGGVLYTLDGNANRRTTTAWSLRPLRKLWSVSSGLQLDPSGTVIHDNGARVTAVGTNLLQQSSTGTTILDARTGTVRWRSPVPVLAYSGGVAVVQETRFAPGTLYDQSSGDPGPLYWSADGVPHTRPPEHTVLHGIDLATGRERWAVAEPGSVFVVSAGGDATGFVVIAADRLAMLAAATGAVVRQRALPPTTGDSYPEIVGGLLILSHGVSDTGTGTATAFALDSFEPRWRRTESGDIGAAAGCSELLCDAERGGLAVLDPRTGAPRWLAPPDVELVVHGPDVLEERTTTNRPLRVRDGRTGAVRVDVTGWEAVAQSDAGAPIMLFRSQPGTGRSGFGVLRPGARRVQLLGLSSVPVQGCGSDDRYVACEIDGGVEVWSYQAR